MPEVDSNGNYLPDHEVSPHPPGFRWSVEYDKYLPLLQYDPKESIILSATPTTAKVIEGQDDRVLESLSEDHINDKIDMVLGRLEKVRAIKFDTGKPPMSLLSRTALEEITKVLEFGRNKYAADNWRQGFEWRRVLDAALRHLLAFSDGEDKDPESGLSHLAHLGCCVMFLLEFEKTHPELDNRYKHVSS